LWISREKWVVVSYVGGGGGGAASSVGFHVRPSMPPIRPKMKPTMKPPVPPTKRLNIEKISTIIEPVFTLSRSPLLIMTAPTITIIPNISPRKPRIMTRPPSHPSPGITPIIAPPIIPTIAPNIPPSSIKTPAIKERTKEGSEKDLAELREKVIRLEERVNELSRRIESLGNYTRQLYEYLAKRK